MNRRNYVKSMSGSVLFVGLAGCLSETYLDNIILEITNTESTSKTLHFALESDNTLSNWHKLDIDGNDSETYTLDIEKDEIWSDYYLISGENNVNGSLLGQGSSNECIQLNFTFRDEDISATFSTNQEKCSELN